MSRKRATASRPRISDRDMVAEIAAALTRYETTQGKLTAKDADALVRVQYANARLERQSNPLAFKEVVPEPWPTAPTKEQQAKAEYHRKPEAGGVYSHRVKSPFESLSKHYPDKILLAFTRFVVDAESHAKLHPRTTNYDSTGGSGFGSRIGGLSQAEERVRDQYHRHKRIVGYLRSVGEEYVDVLRWLVIEVRNYDTERMPDITEVGRRLVPTIIDRATSRGISIGYLKAVGLLLVRLYRHDFIAHGDEYRRNHDEFEEAET